MKNIGTTSLNNQPFQVKMDGIVDSSGAEGHSFTVPSLLVDQEYTHQINNYKAKASTTPTPTLATADKSYAYPSGFITETNEQNNSLSTIIIPNACLFTVNTNNWAMYGTNFENGAISTFDYTNGAVLSFLLTWTDSGGYGGGISFFNNKLYRRHSNNGDLYRVNTATGERTLITNIGFGSGMGSSNEGLVMDVTQPGSTIKIVVYNPESNLVVRSFTIPNELLYPAIVSDITTSSTGKHKVVALKYSTGNPPYVLQYGIFNMDSVAGTFDYNAIAWTSYSGVGIEEVMGTIYYTVQGINTLFSLPAATSMPTTSIHYTDLTYGCSSDGILTP